MARGAGPRAAPQGRRPRRGRAGDRRGRPHPDGGATVSHALSRIIDGFRGLDVLVVGEAMLDSYLEGTTDRLCREAPVPIVALDGRRDAPGGAANVAANAAALGARVRFLSV